VIGIIGTLLGLFLPAVQMVRAAAARTQCQNNLKNIALAALDYHDTLGAFPPGLNVSPNSKDPNPRYTFPVPWCGPYTGSLAYLLPFIEQGNVYNELYNFNPPGAGLTPGALFQLNTTCPAWAYGFGQFDFKDPNVPPSLWNGTGRGYCKAINTKISTYLCPADPGIRAIWVVDAWLVNFPPELEGGFDSVYNVPGYGAEFGRSNYLGVGGAWGLVPPNATADLKWAPYTGIYYCNSQTRVADVTDGTTNTLAFGEWLGELHNNGSRAYETTWMGTGWKTTELGLKPIYGPSINDYSTQFQSKHPGGIVNFAFADGSVHGISQTVDFIVFTYAGGMRDGKVFSTTGLYE
jgi:prepilin-type processing-associated H-X9-DG protein